MNLINLKELIKYHSYHISTFAQFANVTQDLLEAALAGEEELTAAELRKISRYVCVPYSVLSCPKMIVIVRENGHHRTMIEELENEKLYQVWDAQKAGSKEADMYMKCCGRTQLVNLSLDFHNGKKVSYCRYIAVKQHIDDCLESIQFEKMKPRGRRGIA